LRFKFSKHAFDCKNNKPFFFGKKKNKIRKDKSEKTIHWFKREREDGRANGENVTMLAQIPNTKSIGPISIMAMVYTTTTILFIFCS